MILESKGLDAIAPQEVPLEADIPLQLSPAPDNEPAEPNQTEAVVAEVPAPAVAAPPAVKTKKKAPAEPKEPAMPKFTGTVTYQEMARKYAHSYGLDPILLRAVISVESGWNPKATSTSGAKGLMQLMPDTATHLGVTNPYDPEQSIRAGAKYLSRLVQEFGNASAVGSAQWVPAIAAYHAGPGKLHDIGDYRKIPNTQRYVRKVETAYTRIMEQKSREVAYLLGGENLLVD
jgi:soluble lytic murein transglycosylase-like protein